MLNVNFKYTVLAIVFLMALPLAGCEDGSSAAAAPEAPKTQVRYMVLEAQDIPLVQNLPGRVAAQTVSEVRPQVSGIIKQRLFEEGSDVKAGQVLYQIDPQLYQAAYDSAMAGLKQAEANETSSRLLAERYAVLVKSSAVSKQEYDDAVAARKQTAAAIDVAKATLESARINLEYTKVTAPVDGRIGRSHVTEGALVTQNQAAPLATVQQLDPIYVDISLSSTEMLRMRKSISEGGYSAGSRSSVDVRLHLEDGSLYTRLQSDGASKPEPVSGTLLFSDINVDQGTGTVSMRVKIANPDNILLPGMYVKAELEGGFARNMIAIPQKTVQRDARGVFSAYVLKPGGSGGADDYVVEQRILAVERNYGNNWVVSAGLEPGELLLVDGLQKVRSGQMVSAVAVESERKGELAEAASQNASGMR